VNSEQLALVQGWGHTKAAMRAWQARPGRVLVPWTLWSLAVSALLLATTYAVAELSTPDPGLLHFAGVTHAAGIDDYVFVLFRNSLVLALHAMACVAGFIAGSSLPTIAEGHSGWYRKLHEIAQPLAIGFVICATLFSLGTQAYVLGGDTASLAAQFGVGPAELLAVLSLHAIPELTALFLPLAAWTMASRRGEWENLLAATFITVAVAIPVLLLAAAVEVYVTPRVLLALMS
jgi:stage II sporulation SpoM-like protein